jgi:hypothetical protein
VVAVLMFGGDGTQDRIVRAALVAPVVIYVLWWLAWPGLSRRADEPQPSRDIEAIASAFDSAEDYRAARPRREPPTRAFRGRIRRDESAAVPADLQAQFRSTAN